MKKQECYYIVFRSQGGGGQSSGDFETLQDAVKYADEVWDILDFSYYVIYCDNCAAYPYGSIAVFRGDQMEFKKNNGQTFQEKQAQLDKWNCEELAAREESNL